MHVAPLFAMRSKADHSINYLFKYLAFDFLDSFSWGAYEFQYTDWITYTRIGKKYRKKLLHSE